METATERRVVEKAAEAIGGEEELAARLGLHARTVRAFIAGRLPLPKGIFLQVIDIITPAGFPGEPKPPAAEPGKRIGH